MTKHSMPIIILAAGASRRMQGRDKLLEDVDGQPILRQQALKAVAVTSGPVLIALPPEPHARYAALEGLDVQNLPVPDAREGMNASLRTAFGALPNGSPCAMLLLADLPDLTADDLRCVADAVDLGSDMLVWRGVTQSGAAGHPVVFHADLFGAIAALKGDAGAADVMAQAAGRICKVPLADDRARRDLDTPEDWQAWRAGQR